MLLSVTAAKADDRICLAEAMYHEARGQGSFGMLAVGIVIKNRVKHPNYPDTACGVVRQGRHWKGIPIRHKCQFSYWCDGRPEKIEDHEAWTKALDFAKLILDTTLEISGLENVTHYHSNKVQPRWSRKLTYKKTVGRHLFYAKKRSGL